MKNVRFKLHLAAVAFVVGIAAAFASSSLNANSAWFYLDSAGQPVEKITGAPECDPGNADCARMFNLDENGEATTPIGQAVEGALHN
jgi:hypothetical protein